MLAAANLGATDWIEDFDSIKAHARSVIEHHFDHAFILDSRDTDLIAALRNVEPCRLYLLDEKAPTAERIAEELFGLLLPGIASLRTVRIWETEVQCAEYTPLK